MRSDSGDDFKLNWVSASEIGSHAFCARSAWLAFSGVGRGATERLVSGQRAHEGRENVYRIQRVAHRAGMALLVVAAVAFLIYFLLR